MIRVFHCLAILALLSSIGAAQEQPRKQPTASEKSKTVQPATTGPTRGESGRPSPDAEQMLDGEPVIVTNIPPAANDEAFNRYVIFSRLSDVLNSRDPGALADFALLTAEAEKVLGRSHRSGVTAQQLVELAAELARQESDSRTVDRLRKRTQAAYSGLKVEREEAGTSTQKLIEGMRNAAKNVPSDISPEAKETFEGILDDIKTAVLLQNGDRLNELGKVAERQPGLTPAMREQIGSIITAASKDSPRETVEAKSLSGFLAQLVSYAGAIFYEHSWGGGATYTIYGDSFERSNMPEGWNDVVSSLWVRRRHLVYCYEHVNYGGARCWVLVESDGTPASSPFRDSRVNGEGLLFEMSSHGWNDVISSFRLQLR